MAGGFWEGGGQELVVRGDGLARSRWLCYCGYDDGYGCRFMMGMPGLCLAFSSFARNADRGLCVLLYVCGEVLGICH